ncbi:hypothetical protein GP475_01530 [Corynebacterium poyangense]|uniref:Uncharacterized protein n=1 Tax=Corynebacterium poyangense TaxID=2684405 RepID=A0A7H0SLN1_9CORY|nr:type II secretion system F family protein [Corynebacterium poyangense]MBZ8177557.1 hypothetical protein [Corynebacterium poyangense]QNQ89456.1 hypothetical protein GP475_01530 [Corynebacterium poyangense]
MSAAIISALVMGAVLLHIPAAPLNRLALASHQRRTRIFTGVQLILVGLAVSAVLLSGHITTVVAMAVLILSVGWLVTQRRELNQSRRRRQLVALLLSHVVADLKAGTPIDQALFDVLRSGVIPESGVGAQLHSVIQVAAARAQAGGSGSTVLQDSGTTFPELAHLGQLWASAQQHGIPLGAILEQAQRRIDAQEQHHRSTSASLQGPQATAVILSLLPLAGIALGATMGAHPVEFLFGGGLGGLLLLSGVTLVSAGLCWSHLIITKARGGL